MLVKTEGVILHIIKYSEGSIIATVYTGDYGRQAYIINNPRRKVYGKRPALQPMFLVELVAYHKDSRDVQRIKEIKNYPVYQNIPFDISKSTQSLFLSEILYKTLREQESSPELFSFIKNSFLFFDLAEGPAVNFHLYFLFHLTEYLGFLPGMNKAGLNGWFDMRQGLIVPYEPVHPFFISKEATKVLYILSTLKLKELKELKILRSMRGYLTEKLVEYYRLHMENLGEIKSLKVLHEVFA
jgi:DNA repair protein RecO (recombination protein O)